MNSYGINGKFWILAEQGRVVDCSGDEHARYARGVMLNLFEEDFATELPIEKIFSPLSVEDVKFHRERAIGEAVISFLCVEPVDPRVYVIREYDWIRTRDNSFYAWEWDRETMERLATCDEFWNRQPNVNDQSWLEFVELKSGKIAGKTYAALKEYESCLSGTGS